MYCRMTNYMNVHASNTKSLFGNRFSSTSDLMFSLTIHRKIFLMCCVYPLHVSADVVACTIHGIKPRHLV